MKGSKLLSDTNPTVTARSDSLVIFNSDPSVVTPYSDAVVVTLYSVVVRGLCELCVEFFIVYSVNQQ